MMEVGPGGEKRSLAWEYIRANEHWLEHWLKITGARTIASALFLFVSALMIAYLHTIISVPMTACFRTAVPVCSDVVLNKLS